MMSDQVAPFRVEVPQDALGDLHQRLTRTRWPEVETVTDWSQGVPRSYLRELCRYWADGYDWRATEQRLNSLPQFRTELDGLGIHFLHVRSPHRDALPLVITHGWPGWATSAMAPKGATGGPASAPASPSRTPSTSPAST
jgi:hypothetical protein